MGYSLSVLAFAGSLRQGSHNKALLRNARELASNSLDLTIFDLEGIPLYNADLEAGVILSG